ncbi:hypothetical protein ACFFRR_006404 [Megaselia abdita]
MSTVKDNIVFGGNYTPAGVLKHTSLGSYLLENIRGHGDDVLYIDALTGREYTAKEFYDRVIRMIYCLIRLNVKESDVVGLSSENCFDYIVVLFATFCVNATAAPFNVTYSEREFDHAINLSKPKVFFTSKGPAERVAKVARKNNYLKHVFIFDDVSSFKGVIPFAHLIDNPKIKSGADYQPKPTKVHDRVALIVCSSGTTGMPKGVQITQFNILSTIDTQMDPEAVNFGGIPVLSVIPWFHAFGCLTLIMCTCMGTQLIYLPKFEETVFLGAIEKYRVMLAFMVPPLMVFLAKHPIVDKYDLSSLVMLLSGAAPLSKETEDAIKARIGVPTIRQGYGLSEGTLSLTVQSDEKCKPGSVGVLRKGLYAKVIDTETGKPLGKNQRGELCFKGDCIMKGYIGDKNSTDAMIKNGWLHTGDIGFYDEDFEFFIVDRIKELIKYKAFQVPPAEIEALLLTHDKIKDVAVVGKPDESAGELPFAFVVKQNGANLTEQEVMDFVAANASSPKKLRGGVKFVNEIPKNASGKILRRVLREMLKRPKSKL